MSSLSAFEKDFAARQFLKDFANLVEEKYPHLNAYFTRNAKKSSKKEDPTRNSHSFFFSLKRHWKGKAVYIALESASCYVSLVFEKSLKFEQDIRNEILPVFSDVYQVQLRESNVFVSKTTPFFDVTGKLSDQRNEVLKALDGVAEVLEFANQLTFDS